uniref:10 kDa putative secreted protein n=1 Tax=Argas monolakensis TaxID=34602 RepID=Q09JM0_ARGMO|nr:10 kDa putative secreted protein [Argas monolakensis]
MRSHEGCWLLRTAGRWPWKLESAKECVTTHLPKQLAPKMDGAIASNLSQAAAGRRVLSYCKPQRVGGPQRCALKVSGVSPPGAAAGADLGGSSKYSSETLED